MKAIGNINQVRSKLLMRGWYSVSEWARAHGYKDGTVRRAIYDWGERDNTPLGGINRQIIADLRKELEEETVEA